MSMNEYSKSRRLVIIGAGEMGLQAAHYVLVNNQCSEFQ